MKLSMGKEILGLALAIIGFLGVIIVCALPMWRVTAFIGSNIVTATGQVQCKVYVYAVVGGQCTNCIEDESSKAKVTVGSGVAFIITGVLCLISVCWSANTIIWDFYNFSQRRELGASLYIGWGAAGLLILGGGLLCTSCPPKEDKGYNVKYSQPRSTADSKAYV
uniref:Uncharacterized protein n=1 Tax=Paramormyrops kingsleyae TaxID=1676925 RepID=A0A3B3SFN0_9TELE